jgi:hypothetical protein
VSASGRWLLWKNHCDASLRGRCWRRGGGRSVRRLLLKLLLSRPILRGDEKLRIQNGYENAQDYRLQATLIIFG